MILYFSISYHGCSQEFQKGVSINEYQAGISGDAVPDADGSILPNKLISLYSYLVSSSIMKA